MAWKRWSLSLVLGISLLGAPISASADEKISPEARAYFRNGVELLQSEPPNYQDAYYQFKLAFEKSQSWKVLGNLGLCAVKLERDGEALSFYDEYLRRGGKQINKDEREAIERDMLLIKGNGATLELTSKAGSLRIQDSRSGSTAAAQTHEMTDGKKSLFVRAGAHKLTATNTDGRTLVWEASIEPGSTSSHDFDFDAPVAAAAPPEAPALATSSDPVSPSSSPHDRPAQRSSALATVGFVAGGVGLAVLGGGIVTGLSAKSKEKSALDKCDPATKVCDPSAEPLFEDAKTMAKTSTALFVAGGVLTAGGIACVIIGYSSKSSSGEQQAARHLRLVPVVSRNSGGLFATGSF